MGWVGGGGLVFESAGVTSVSYVSYIYCVCISRMFFCFQARWIGTTLSLQKQTRR